MQEGPFKSAIEAATDNIIKQELITYYVNDDGNTAKKVAKNLQKRIILITLQLRFLL